MKTAKTLASASVWEAINYTMHQFETLIELDPGTIRLTQTSPPSGRQVRVTVEVIREDR